jgi:hypothetical protein
MTLRSLLARIDRVLLGKEAARRAEDAEARLRQAGVVRAALDQQELAELERLTCWTKDTRVDAQRAAEATTPRIRMVSLPDDVARATS